MTPVTSVVTAGHAPLRAAATIPLQLHRSRPGRPGSRSVCADEADRTPADLGDDVKFLADIRYEAAPDAVFAMLTDPDFQRQVCEATGAIDHSVDVETAGG